MGKMAKYLHLVGAHAFRDYAWMRDFTVGFIVSPISMALCVYFRLGAADDWTKHRWFLIVAVALPYLVIIGVHISWRLIESASQMHRSLQEKLDRQIAVLGIQADDPRIVPLFVDGRKSIEQFVSFEIKNCGRSSACWVRLNPLRLTKRLVGFPDISESIEPTDFRHFYANVADQVGIDGNRDLIKAMNEEWSSYNDNKTRREIVIPARIDYENKDGVRFECNFDIVYHGGRGYNQPPDFKCIECRDISYRRIPKGITPP